MKVAVCVRQVLEVSRYVEFTADGTRVDPAFATTAVNEADLSAVEEALALVEAAGAGEVVLFSAGDQSADEALRAALAMGPQRAVRVWTDGLVLEDPVTVGAALAQAIAEEDADLVLCGVQSADTGQQSTGPVIAAALGMPCVAVAHSLSAADATLTLQRDFEGGVAETVAVDLPAVVTIQVGANVPRYGNFKDKMRAKKADIPVREPSGLPEARAVVSRLNVAPGGSGRNLEMIQGGPAEVAARIVALVREQNR